MQFYQVKQKQNFRLLISSFLLSFSVLSYSQLIVTIDDGTQDFCYGDSIEINHISFEESDTNNFGDDGFGNGTININIPNGFKAYSQGDNVTIDAGSGTSNIEATNLAYNNDSSQIILTYEVLLDNNKEKISIEDIVLKPKAGQASYGTQFTIDGNGYQGFNGATDTTIGRFRMNNLEIELNSFSSADSCSHNPLTLNFGLNNVYATSCLDSIQFSKLGKAPNNSSKVLLHKGKINNTTFSIPTDEISLNDSLVIVDIKSTNSNIVSDTFTIGGMASGKDIMLFPSQEPEYYSNQFSTSAYLYRYYMRDTIENYNVLNTIDNSRYNSYYYSFEVLSESSPVPGAVGVNTYSNSKNHYLNSSSIGAGIYDMVMSREHPASHCIVRDTVQLLIVPDVVDVAQTFCYVSDTADTVTVSRTWVENYPVEGADVHHSITRINRLVVKYGDQDGIELLPDNINATDVKYPFNPTEIYDTVTAGLTTSPKEIFIQFELYANVDLYKEVEYVNCIPYWGCYTYYTYELITSITMPIESATATILQGKDDGYLAGLDTTLCQNQEAIELIGSYFTDSISEPAYLEGNDWLLNPARDLPNKDSVFSITYYYRDNNNCPEDTTLNINIYEVPKLDLSFTTICVGDTVNFSQNNPIRTDTNNINEWYWEFGDGFTLANETAADTTVANNTHGGRTSGTLRSPSHRYDEANTYKVSLTTSTDIGCESSKDTTITIGSYPVVDFNYTGKITEAPVRISNLSTNKSFDPVSNYEWEITDPLGNAAQLNTAIIEPLDTSFTTNGVYNIELTVTTNNGCAGSKNRKIPSFPIIKVESDNLYDQGFGSSTLPDGWIASKDYLPQVSGWEYVPVSGVYNDNDKHTTGYMWLTGNPQDSIINESGWVESPCFDLSDLDFPMLSIDIFESIEENRDGGIIQYTLDDGNTWETFGAIGTGNNWYNARGITSTPGADTNSTNDNGYGWSENTNEWTTARHALEEVRDLNSSSACVRFRIMYNSDNYTPSSYTGFAFDNVHIGKRKRVILIEEFVNSELESTDHSELETFLANRNVEVCDIRYHMVNGHKRDVLADFGCWQDVSARVTEYKVSDPKSILDGKELNISYKDDFSIRALNDPTFDIFDVNTSLDNGVLHIKAKIQKLSDRLEEYYGEHNSLVRVAIVQKEMTDSEGTVHNNVLVDLLPNGVGNVVEIIESDVEVGTVIDINTDWKPCVRTIDNNFRLIIYVQARWGIDEIQQVWFSDLPNTVVPEVYSDITTTELSANFEMYPNPMREKLHIKCSEVLNNKLSWSVYSLNGMLVKQGFMHPGDSEVIVQVEDLAKGLYLVELQYSDGTRVSKKIAKVLD